MRTLILALIPGLLLACNNDITTTAGADGSTGGESTDTTPTSPGTNPTTGASGGSTTASTTSTTTASSEPGTVTNPTSESATDSTGSGVCGGDGVVIDATLVHLGEDPGCGALEFTGSNDDLSPGPVYTLDGCPCGASCIKPDPWTLTLDVPQEWLPRQVPSCPRVVVERQMSKAGCELVGVAIWDMQKPEAEPAVYHAGSVLGPIAAAADEITIKGVVAEECECASCCRVPTRWDLAFGALESAVTIAEGQTGLLGDQNLGYEIINFQSHISGICDDPSAVDWVARRLDAR